MKVLKRIGLGLLALVALWLIVAAFVPGATHYEKSITIQAPTERVWEEMNSLKKIDQWSPWNAFDPQMKKTWSGETGKVGETMSWEGNDKAGKGTQTITAIDPVGKTIESEMLFLTPYESEAKATYTLVPENEGSKVTWGFDSTIPYPFTVMKLFMNLENSIGSDFQRGLEDLKRRAEQP